MVVGEIEIGTDVLVIGAGPAGYTAAIRCGQAGLDVTLVGPEIGGVCLNHGCIPIKVLAGSLDIAEEAKHSDRFGILAKDVSVDISQLQAWKNTVVRTLESGISNMLSSSGVQVFKGKCSFTSSSTAIAGTVSGSQHIRFKRAVIATGAHFKTPDGVLFDGSRILTPYGIVRLKSVPEDAVILGGGVAGATVAPILAKMGAHVTLAYKGQSLAASLDDDVLEPAMDWFKNNGVQLLPGSKWVVSRDRENIEVKIVSNGQEHVLTPEKVIIASPLAGNTNDIGLEIAKVAVDEKGFVKADDNFRTSSPQIYAIGDVLGSVRNASVAYREGLSVAEILSGKPGLPAIQAMPQTLYSEPPIASAGLSEKAAKKAGISIITGRSPYSANGNAVSHGFSSGLVKVVADQASHRILGVQISGKRSPEMIGEAILAIETGARLEDIALTLHPHPELTEALQDACARACGLSYNANK